MDDSFISIGSSSSNTLLAPMGVHRAMRACHSAGKAHAGAASFVVHTTAYCSPGAELSQNRSPCPGGLFPSRTMLWIVRKASHAKEVC